MSALPFTFTFGNNTLISIAPLTPSVSITTNTTIEIQIGSGPIQKRQRLG